MNDNPISKFITQLNKLIPYFIILLLIIWAGSFVHWSSVFNGIQQTRNSRSAGTPSIKMDVINIIGVGPNETKTFILNKKWSKWISVNPVCGFRFITSGDTVVKFQYRNGNKTRWFLPNENVKLKSNTFRAKTQKGVTNLTIVAGGIGSVGKIY